VPLSRRSGWLSPVAPSASQMDGVAGAAAFATPSRKINCRNSMLPSHAIKGGGKSKKKNGKSEKKFTISVGIPSAPSLSDEAKTVCLNYPT